MGINISKIGANKWLLDVRVWKDEKEIRKRETFIGNKNEAELRYMALKQEMRWGFAAVAKARVFQDLIDAYRDKKVRFRPQEEDRLRRITRDLGDIPLSAFAERFEVYFNLMRKSPSPTTGKALANATLNRLLNLVRAIFNLAVRMEVIERNPITLGRFPKLKEIPRDKVLDEAEVSRLLEIIRREAPHLEAIFRFAIQVPCRRSELVNMRREDLDLVHNAIRIRSGTTKNDQGCWKPIPPDMVDYFRSIPPGCPFLFYRQEKGGYAPLGCFKKAWGRCLKLAGISDFRFHDTRHISATNLLDNGTPEHVVMTVAGWKTNMLRTYYHRSGKKSLSLVRFTPGGGGQFSDTRNVDTAVKSGFSAENESSSRTTHTF